MKFSTRVRIEMRDNTRWEIVVKPDALKEVGGLRSGRVVRLNRRVKRTDDVQTQDVLIKPYYRRFIKGELHVFAVEVLPS